VRHPISKGPPLLLIRQWSANERSLPPADADPNLRLPHESRRWYPLQDAGLILGALRADLDPQRSWTLTLDQRMRRSAAAISHALGRDLECLQLRQELSQQNEQLRHPRASAAQLHWPPCAPTPNCCCGGSKPTAPTATRGGNALGTTPTRPIHRRARWPRATTSPRTGPPWPHPCCPQGLPKVRPPANPADASAGAGGSDGKPAGPTLAGTRPVGPSGLINRPRTERSRRSSPTSLRMPSVTAQRAAAWGCACCPMGSASGTTGRRSPWRSAT